MNLDDENSNLHSKSIFSECLFSSILKSIFLNYCQHHPSPPRPHQFSPTVSIFNICVWTNTLNWFFCAADFLKDRTAERKLVVSLKQVSRNLIPAVSPIHHLPSCSTFSSDILINSCYAMIYDDFNLPPASFWPREFPGG